MTKWLKPSGKRVTKYRDSASVQAVTSSERRALKAGPVDVVGHSDSGNIALLLARDHRELVRRLVISGANRRGLPPDKLEARQAIAGCELEEQVAKLAAMLPPSFRTDYGAVSPTVPTIG